MNLPVRTSNAGAALAAVLLSALLAACGGDKLDPVLGSPAFGVAPTVTVTTPATTPVASGVATNSTVTARFSKPMAAASITPASFTLACPAGTATAASVVYVEATQTATLTPNAVLPVNTLCTATISTAVRDSGGIPLANAYVWTFQTAPLADTTRPTVALNTPAQAAVGVSINSRVVATFSEDMNPATLTAASFTLTNTTLGAPVAGSVGYAPAGRTATFTPTAALAANSLFTATLTSAATDSAGNALAGNAAVPPAAGNHVWTFTTGATPDAVAPTVATISPAIASTGVCLTRSVTASFSEAMDAATITSTSFTVTDGGVAVPGSVSYDAATRLASFVPTAAAGFAASRPLVATVRSGATGVTDLAGNPLAVDQIWNFTTGASACAAGVNLRSAAAFGAFGGAAGVTNQGINTVVGGNLGSTAACTLITGLHDAANVYTETPLNIGGVNGSIYCAPPAPGTTTTLAIATQARADAQTAYNELAALPPGLDPGAGQLGGLVLAAGTYTSAGGTFAITSGDLTLDAQGDSNAVFVFQSASALTVGQLATPRRVLLVGGAQARNVFWQVGSAARIEDGSTMVGTIIAPAGVTISTAGQTAQTTLIGRAIGLTASVTMVNTTVTAP